MVRKIYGVHQGGYASPVLFRKYTADPEDYLTKQCGLCIADNIIVHI